MPELIWDHVNPRAERTLAKLMAKEIRKTRCLSKTEGRRLVSGVEREFPELYELMKEMDI